MAAAALHRGPVATVPARLVERAVRLPLMAIVAIAVGARLVAGLAIPASGTSEYEFGRLARNVVDGHGYSYYSDDPVGRLDPEKPGLPGEKLPSAHMPPAYTGLTAVAVGVAGSHTGMIWMVRLLNAAAAVGGLLAIHALARRLTSERAAKLAALGFALYPSMVYAATQVSAANVYLPAEMAALVLMLGTATAAGPGAWRRWALAGLVVGMVCLLRSEAVLFVPLAAVWLVSASRREATPSRRSLRLAAVFLAVAVLPAGVWLVRNSVALDAPVLTITTTGGSNLWIGNHHGASGSAKGFTIPTRLEDEILALDAGNDFEVQVDALYRREALDAITDDPIGTVARDAEKAVMLGVADVHDRRNLNPIYLLSYAALLLTGIAGLLRWWRSRPRGDPARRLVAGYLLVAVCVSVVFFVLARYRLPIEALLLVFAGAWLAGRYPAPPASVQQDEGREAAGYESCTGR
jgi:4-amino-4-deoxy-L-arabinose transferase-like glycosyltransferase